MFCPKKSIKYLNLLILITSCTPVNQGSDTLFEEPVDTTLARDARAEWMREVLLSDNRDLFERSPDLTRAKLRKMASHPYFFFRGSAAIAMQELLTPGLNQTFGTDFGSATTSHILLVGDPHPENVGTYLDAQGVMSIAFNDFDAATHGPAHLDLWRLATGTLICIDPDATLPDTERQALISRLAGSYYDTLHSDDTDTITRAYQLQPEDTGVALGTLFTDLVRRARRDGRISEELDEYAPVQDGQRVMFTGMLEPIVQPSNVDRDTLLQTSEAERDEIQDAITAYIATLINPPENASEFFTIKGSTRRLGAGVSSYPVRRYYVLVEGTTAQLEDDILLELKETLDIPGTWANALPSRPMTQFESSAHRVMIAQRALHHTTTQDPYGGWASSHTSAVSWRVRWRTKYQRGVGCDRIEEKLAGQEWTPEDMLDLAGHLGTLLGLAHMRAPSLSEGDTAQSFRAKTSGRREDFIDEAFAFSNRYAHQTRQDYERFRALLALHGDALGYRSQQSDGASAKELP